MIGSNSIQNNEEAKSRIELVSSLIEVEPDHNILAVEDILCILSPDHTVLWQSRAGFQAPEAKAGENAGKKCFELFCGEGSCEECTATYAAASGRAFAAEKHIQNLNRSFRCTSSPVVGKDGNVHLVIVQMRDISKYKKAEEDLRESDAKFKGLYESSPIGIEIYDSKGSLMDVNKACLDIFGILDLEDIRGFSLFNDPNLPQHAQEMLLSGKTAKYECAFDFEKVKDLKLYRTSRSGLAYIYVIISPLFLDGSRIPSNYIVQVQDTTQRKISEEQLIASESKFSAAFRISPNPLAISEIESGEIIDVNEAYEKGTGFSREELIGRSPLELNIWMDKDQRDKIIRRLKKGEEVNDSAVKLRRKDGAIRDMLYSASFVTISGKIYLLSQAHDITDRNKAAEALSRSEERLRLALDAAKMSCWEWDLLRDEVFCRGELFGTADPPQGSALNPGNYWFQKLIHLDDRRKVNSAINDAIEKCSEYDIVFRTVLPKGDVRWISSRGRAFAGSDGKAVRMMGIDVDITDSHQADLVIQEKENQKRALLDNMPDMIWLKDSQGRFLAANESFAKACGRSVEYIVGRSDRDIWPIGLAKLNRANDIEVMAKRKQITTEELLEDAEGTLQWMEIIKTPIINKQGQVIGTTGIARDITERKMAEKELFSSRARYLDLYNNAPNAYFSISADGLIIMCSARAGELLEYPNQSLIGRSFLELCADTPDGREKAKLVFHDFLICKPTTDIELQMQKSDGSPIWVSLTVSAIRDDQERIIEIRSMVMDITERKKAEEALKEYQRSMEEIIDFLPDATFVIDKEGKIIAWNKAIEKMTGLREEEMMGQGNYEYAIPFYGCRRPILIDLVLKSNKKLENEYIDIKRLADGTLTGEAHMPNLKDGGIYLQGKAAALFSSHGEIVGAIESIRDITERKLSEDALKSSEAKYRAIVEDMPNVLCRFNPDGTLTFVNDEYCKLMGISKSKIHGCSFFSLIPNDAEKEIKENLSLLCAARPVASHEQKVIMPDGNARWYLWTNRALFDQKGRVVEYQTIGEDITDINSAKEALVRAKEAAEDAARAKSEFLANMSHEIRTPLNAIIGMTGILLDTQLTSKQREAVDTLRSSGDALMAVISDILDFSKIDAGRRELEKQPFHLRSCLESSIGLLETKAREKCIALKLSIEDGVPENIIGDVTCLRQILLNLLSNAVKFTDKGEVAISVKRMDLPECMELEFSVRDTGIGIPPGQMTRLFQSFSQGDATLTRRYGGTGLGLAISKRLVELMGGRIWAESEIGKGSVFHFTMKTDAASESFLEKKLEMDIPESDNFCCLRVLLAEDNIVNQKVALHMLSKVGIRADVASNGREVLEALQRQPYDVVLMDVAMPEMDGFEAARAIRKLRADRPYIIAVTAHSLDGDREKCLESGMNDYISKPVRMEELVGALERCLSRRSERD